MSTDTGHGVQVVSVGADADGAGAYQLCVEALRDVVARTELATRPVVLISVAGATRGGKSFLLDFFLRYLRATPAARSDGSWLGANDEPLSGFSWRGGCERDTAGILLWSDPIPLTLADGKQVVVLLMDTQGTFDSNSTIRDSIIIFAISTLLSSVQIYNLSQNIQEDDLQYLQLFTEYGKLATDEFTGKPFQMLQFLVRDWSYAYQHPFGAVGGQQLLDKRLQISDSQVDELKEIRQHIGSCFECVRGFLMPHPGLTVANSPTFTGCLAEISTEFRGALQELVHELFENNLTPKRVNGQEIRLQDLVGYFENYIQVFNSDELPTPLTILKATSAACLDAALSAARDAYAAHMERGVEARSVPRDAVPRLHAAAKQAARQAFQTRRTLAAPAHASERLERLMQDLEGSLPTYIELNQARVEKGVAESKIAYENHMLVEQCLNPSELEERHREAVDLALELFDGSRVIEDGGDFEDDERADLKLELEELLKQHEERNESRIRTALSDAYQLYEQVVTRPHAVAELCTVPTHLRTLHQLAKADALQSFQSRWRTDDSTENEHCTALLYLIEDRYKIISLINESNNKLALDNALQNYDNAMNNIFDTNYCLHRMDLQSENKALYDSTVVMFEGSKTHRALVRDNYKLELIRELTTRYKKFYDFNETRNKTAVKQSHAFYETNMNIRRLRDDAANVIVNFFGPPDFSVLEEHNRVRSLALNLFLYEKRRPDPRHEQDTHLDELNKMIRSSYVWLLARSACQTVMSIAQIVFITKGLGFH